MKDIGSSVFTYSQVYVALSRETSLGGLYLVNIDFKSIKVQETATVEYNRLRNIYRPDLCALKITKHHNTGNRVRDREWALSKAAAEAQVIIKTPKNKRKRPTKN